MKVIIAINLWCVGFHIAYNNPRVLLHVASTDLPSAFKDPITTGLVLTIST